MTRWKRTIHGVADALIDADDGTITNRECMARIAAILMTQPEYEQGDFLIWDVAEEMADPAPGEVDQDYANLMLAAMYDWADAERIWIGRPRTWGSRSGLRELDARRDVRLGRRRAHLDRGGRHR